MKLLLLALVLSGVASESSLDIGLDVLPEAFSFAAHKVGFTPTLRLSKCTQTACLWDIGHGIEMTVDHRGDDIRISRIEAKLRPTKQIAPEALRQFENACLTIVGREGGDAQRRATAKAIATSTSEEPSTHIEMAEGNIRFYGARSGTMIQDKADVVLRCGVAANS